MLQNFSRKNKIPIDQLGFEFEVTIYEPEMELKDLPERGVYCRVRTIFQDIITSNLIDNHKLFIDIFKIKCMFNISQTLYLIIYLYV